MEETFHQDEQHYDVIINGYGPIGQMLANLLGRAGHRVAAIERHLAFYPLPRAVHFDHEVARIFQSIGLRPDQSTAIEPYDAMYASRNADRKNLQLVDWTGIGPNGWHSSNFFSQPLLEPQLDELARRYPNVSVQRGWELVAVEDELDQPLTLVVEETDGFTRTGNRRTLTARYIIGADGANSVVRTEMGAPMHDLGFFFDWLIIDLVLHEDRVFDPPAWQLCDPKRPTTIVPGGPGKRRWEFMRLPEEDIKDLNTLERAWELLEPWGVRPGNATIERHTVYTFQARWVESWRRGRLMIAGDAAHLMPPFAGQGMCAGMRDASNLAWKLDLVLQGKAEESLLDTYGPERTPHVRGFIDFSMELGGLICITDPDAAAERDRRMIAALTGDVAAEPPPAPRLGPGLLHEGDPVAGTVSIQAPVTTTAGSGLFDDVVGAGCLLLSSDAVDVDASRREALVNLGIAVVALRTSPATGRVVDDTGAYQAWLDELNADAVLVRPDFAVYGTARHGDDVAKLVDGFLTGLGQPGAAPAKTAPAAAQA